MPSTKTSVEFEHIEGKTRPDSWFAILDAAVEEFAEHGRTGVRMEHVAKRAGYNKTLVYRFFKDKDTLFQAALSRQFQRRDELLPDVPSEFTSMLSWWHERNRANPLFIRMILREALDTARPDAGEAQDAPAAAQFREAYYQDQIEVLRNFQAKGEVADNLPSDFLFLALLGISILPTALPQICQLVTGLDTGSQDFQDKWQQFLGAFSQNLQGDNNA